MPIAFDPEATHDIPLGNGVAVRCRFLTVRQRQRWWRHFTAAAAACDAPETETDEQRAARWKRCDEELRAAMAVGVLGPAPGTLDPEGNPVPMTVEGLEDVLTMGEIWELAGSYPEKLTLGETEKKRSGSPAPSAGAESAKAADPAAAPTSPPPPNP